MQHFIALGTHDGSFASVRVHGLAPGGFNESGRFDLSSALSAFSPLLLRYSSTEVLDDLIIRDNGLDRKINARID